MIYSDRLNLVSEKLSATSVKKYNNPYTTIEWPEQLDDKALCFSKDMISISRTPLFQDLTEEQVLKLALYEAVNFFSLNISGERELIAGLSKRLYKNYSPEMTEYIHHFLDEENKHMVWFGTFSEKYAGKVYQDKKIVFPRSYEEGEEDFLFFTKIVIFEEIVDRYNYLMAGDESLDPLVRQIHHQHHVDESRHLAFGREIVCHLYKEFSPRWSEETRDGISDYIKNYMVSTWKEYFNPDVYVDAGITDEAYELRELAWNSMSGFRKEISHKCVEFFQKKEFIKGEPEL